MEVKAKILRKEMAAREERRGTEGTGTGGEGEVEFAKRGEGIEEAGDGNTGRGGVPTVELRKSTGGRGRHRRRRWSGVECGARRTTSGRRTSPWCEGGMGARV